METGGESSRRKLFKLENIESCWTFMKENSIESFTELFCNETLSRVYRLIIFSSDLEQDNKFLNEVKNAIDKEAIKRKFDCFQPVNKCLHENVFNVVYCDRRIIKLY